MHTLLDLARTRLAPALLTAAGVVLITAGLLSYADPIAGVEPAEPTPPVAVVLPTEEPAAQPSPTAQATAGPSSSPTGSPADPTPTPGPEQEPVATRVVVPALKIDMPVIRGPDAYPYCNVAMYQPDFAQPGENWTTYIYAHARDGMFGPIFRLAIETGRPRKLLGLIVQVYTSDDKLYLYEVKEVLLHQTTYKRAIAAKSEELWLQTSEGPAGTVGKTQLRAVPITSGAADPKDAHPKAKPVVCG